MEWIIVVVALIAGGGAGAGIAGAFKKDSNDETGVVQAEVAKQLSNMDILKEPCSQIYIEERGDGLCREMFCWAQTNSTTGEASGISCDAISNVNNTITILDICGRESQISDAAVVSCHTLFRERK